MGQENITLILLGVIGLVFLIDFIKNNSKKSIDKSIEEFVEKDEKKTNSSNPIDWILNRKKNISLSLILLPLLKVLIHYMWFPQTKEIVVNAFANNRTRKGFTTVKEEIRETFGYHLDLIFTDRLELFIPVTIVFLIVVWFFNDKIKAQ